MVEDTYAHFERTDVVAEYASFDFLLEPEEAILSLFKGQIEGRRVLDLGVGAGRTTVHIAPLARAYLGVDVSEAMINACRQRFSRKSGVSFLVLDARDLRLLEDESFDFVLFSFNGLDLVGDHDSRLRALAEMRRVCRPGGLVCFSSENLNYIEACLSHRSALAALRGGPVFGFRRWMRLIRHTRARTRMWRRLNPPRRTLARVEHAMITEERTRQELSSEFFQSPGDRIQVQRYFVRPAAQVRQLEAAGFAGARLFDPDGVEVTDRLEGGIARAWWLYYVAERIADDGPGPP